MIKVAICNDDIAVCSLLEEFLFQYGKESSLNLEVEVYYSGKNLYNAMKQGASYHIVFMDINLNDDMSGIETGSCIRKKLNNYETQLIYVSASQNLSTKIFDNIVFGYADKPFDYEKISDIMNNYRQAFKALPESFSFVADRKTEVVFLKDIKYFVINGRRIEMHTSSNQYEFNGRLSQVYEQLNHNLFLYVNKSAIINIKMAKEFFYDKVEMKDGTIIRISQKRRKEILKFIKEQTY